MRLSSWKWEQQRVPEIYTSTNAFIVGLFQFIQAETYLGILKY